MRVLVAGSRFYSNKDRLDEVLDHLHSHLGFTILIHGGAKGADLLAGRWAIDHSIPVKCYLANWSKYGRSAGPIRNRQMLADSKPDLVVAFHGGAGTADMVRRAKLAGIPVHQV